MKLIEYIETNGLTKAEFGRLANMSYMGLWRALNGYTLSVDTVCKIIKATNGDVTLEDLTTDSA